MVESGRTVRVVNAASVCSGHLRGGALRWKLRVLEGRLLLLLLLVLVRVVLVERAGRRNWPSVRLRFTSIVVI